MTYYVAPVLPVVVIVSVVVEKVYFHVYRLEEDVGLLQEGGVRLTV